MTSRTINLEQADNATLMIIRPALDDQMLADMKQGMDRMILAFQESGHDPNVELIASSPSPAPPPSPGAMRKPGNTVKIVCPCCHGSRACTDEWCEGLGWIWATAWQWR